MLELSLHILDLIENSIRAGVTVIKVTVAEDPVRDFMKIVVEDNGGGLSVPPSVALDPFFTTKNGKRVGLGLSLFRAAAEQAQGKLTISKSKLGGLAVTATMKLSHVDRSPLGDLAATLSSVVCTNPNIELTCQLRVGKRECVVSVSDVAAELHLGECRGLAVARQLSEKIKSAIVSLEVRP